MFNVHGDVLSVRAQKMRSTILVYTFCVGFGIAYPRLEGNAKALYAGWAMSQIPALFLYVYSNS